MPTMRAEETSVASHDMQSGLKSPYRAQLGGRSNGIAPRSASTPPDLLDYDALDHENGPWVPDNDDATESEMVYSDFSTIDPNKPIPDDNDFFDPFQGTDTNFLPPNKPHETARGFMWPHGGYDDGSALQYMP